MSYPHFEEYTTENVITTDFVQRLIACNVNSVSCLTRIVMPRLLKQHKPGSAIINVSSTFGLVVSPFITAYGSSKAFMVQFTKSLALEQVDPNRVHIQCVCPMYVKTAMTGIRHTSLFVPSAKTYAASALDMLGIEGVTLGYLPHALQKFFLDFLPPTSVAAHLRGLMERQRRKKQT